MHSCAATSSSSSIRQRSPKPARPNCCSRDSVVAGSQPAPCRLRAGHHTMRPLFTLLLALTCTAEPTPGTRNSALGTPGYDVRIINGDVIDGTGRARFRADVGIRGDKIAAIGDLSHATATTTIDARNQVVTPGFIDLLGHSESSVLIDPNLEGKVRQGVTTEVTGEGHSPGPINDAMAAEFNRTKLPGTPDATWRSLDDFMGVVEKRGSAINFAFYVGAASAREIVLGTADRAPSA